ncbi:hypothetical protein [Limnohabitans sp.]|uniref:hypothetical protein n=1 Tax=Limnohabitans sp. TaxID=1907725 RepID=UPI003BAF9A38
MNTYSQKDKSPPARFVPSVINCVQGHVENDIVQLSMLFDPVTAVLAQANLNRQAVLELLKH